MPAERVQSLPHTHTHTHAERSTGMHNPHFIDVLVESFSPPILVTGYFLHIAEEGEEYS